MDTFKSPPQDKPSTFLKSPPQDKPSTFSGLQQQNMNQPVSNPSTFLKSPPQDNLQPFGVTTAKYESTSIQPIFIPVIPYINQQKYLY